MTPSIEPLSAAVLLLTWQADPGLTYTIQTSPDLENWNTLPCVVHSVEGEAAYGLDNPGAPLFARLRSSDNGDSNENGLPDLWEWATFGALDVNPMADTDGDGKTNYEEWQLGTSATDPLNGETPVLQLTCGDLWQIEPGQPTAYPISLNAYHRDGSPWPDLEVRLHLESGRAGLLRPLGSSPVVATSAVLKTDALGRLGRFNEDVRIMALPESERYERLLLRAGDSEVSILLVTSSASHPLAPVNMRRVPTAEGGWFYTWKGDPAGAESFIIEQEQSDGSWLRVAEMDCSAMPEPNRISGTYSLVVGPTTETTSQQDPAS